MAATIDDAVARVVEAAETAGAVIASWSNHERTVVDATCDSRIAARFADAHHNALETAKPWKRLLYPKFPFVTERFGGSHPLKEYFRMVDYRRPKVAAADTPAAWLRFVMTHLDRTDGNYRKVTALAKARWHNLLVYNEHDCVGMRRVVVQAARELELWRAYESARYVTSISGREIPLHVGSNPKLDVVLASRSTSRWAFITAANPGSIRTADAENVKRMNELREVVLSRGYEIAGGEGRDPEGGWPAEPSLLVLGIGRREARELGRRFGQLAILVGQRGYRAQIVPSGLEPHLATRSSNHRRLADS